MNFLGICVFLWLILMTKVTTELTKMAKRKFSIFMNLLLDTF